MDNLKINLTCALSVFIIGCGSGNLENYPWVTIDSDNQIASSDSTSGPGTQNTEQIFLYAVSGQTGNLNGGSRVGVDETCHNNLPSQLTGYEVHAFVSLNGSDLIFNMHHNFGIPTNLPILSLSDIEVASDWDDFIDGTISMSLFDAGVVEAGEYFWIGTTSGNVGANCNQFSTDSSSTPGLVAEATVAGDDVTAWYSPRPGLPPTCGTPASVICIAYQ